MQKKPPLYAPSLPPFPYIFFNMFDGFLSFPSLPSPHPPPHDFIINLQKKKNKTKNAGEIPLKSIIQSNIFVLQFFGSET